MGAWNKYQSVRNIAGAIGRSLKLVQFLQLSPLSSTTAIADNDNNSDDDDNSNTNIALMLEKSFNRTNNNYINNKALSPMKEDTRDMLRQFFRPYNHRLTKLLRSNGFEGNWDERWK